MVLLHADAGHIVDLLAEEVGGVAFGHSPVGVAEGLRGFVAGEVDPGDGGRRSAGAESGLDGPGAEEGGCYERDEADDEEDRAEVAANRGELGEVEGESSAGREAGAENRGGDRHDESGFGVGELDVLDEIALLVPEELRPVDDLAGGDFVDDFVGRLHWNSLNEPR